MTRLAIIAAGVVGFVFGGYAGAWPDMTAGAFLADAPWGAAVCAVGAWALLDRLPRWADTFRTQMQRMQEMASTPHRLEPAGWVEPETTGDRLVRDLDDLDAAFDRDQVA